MNAYILHRERHHTQTIGIDKLPSLQKNNANAEQQACLPEGVLIQFKYRGSQEASQSFPPMLVKFFLSYPNTSRH